jgi:hypothetical protein
MQRHDALPNLKLARIGTDCCNDASEFVAEDGGLFDERESTLAIEDIAECNGASRNFYEDFATFGEYHWHAAKLKGLCGGRGRREHNRTHKLRESGWELWHWGWLIGYGIASEVVCLPLLSLCGPPLLSSKLAQTIWPMRPVVLLHSIAFDSIELEIKNGEKM